MEESSPSNLDVEYKRYLQILRPYLAQLAESNVITLCNAWIHKLSDCTENEKPLRNKYAFFICYQLARGILEGPFTRYPPEGNLPSISENEIGDDSSSEVECVVVNADDPKTEIIFDGKQEHMTDTEFLSHCNEYTKARSASYGYDSDMKSTSTISKRDHKQTFMCYACPEVSIKDYNPSEIYEHRANNLIKKLRDIKMQNALLQNELMALKQEAAAKPNSSYVEDVTPKADHATSTLLQNRESSTTLKSLKFRLQEVQDSRNNLIDKIAALQDVINNFNDMKMHEIEDIEAKHKLEVLNVKEAIRSEVKMVYEKKLQDLINEYEQKIGNIKSQSSDEIVILSSSKNEVIEEKDKTIALKDKEIVKLNNQIDDLKNHLHSVLEKFIEKPSCYNSGDDSIKFKADQLEKRLNKVEKSKIKCSKIFEAKVAQLQRDKHLAECSLQLQMVRQRAQVVNEVTDENQVELTTALDKLETKYKEIVANMQATAIQRRMQDQIALESILQAACGIPNENNNSSSSNGQFPKTMRNQNPSCNSEISPLLRGNKVGNSCVGNKSFEEDSLVTGFCLNGERMAELFERVYIPQRDSPETLK